MHVAQQDYLLIKSDGTPSNSQDALLDERNSYNKQQIIAGMSTW